MLEPHTDTAIEAAVVSNAGGRVTADALQSIMVLDSFVGVGTVIVVHHTGEFKSDPSFLLKREKVLRKR